MKLLAWAMSANEKSIGVVVMPVFTHRKGQLWLAEKAALDLMHKGDIYADLMATINFKNKVDARDDRPMTYPLRLALPSTVDRRSSLWKGTTSMSIGRTVKSTSSMVVIRRSWRTLMLSLRPMTMWVHRAFEKPNSLALPP